ncbi:hypothetical protein BJX66DRAFT_84659 [Aspergillus keveii]|uniref:Uncharacterized protein n=1 Tax=Aspergillus keveii TaxID=714993 RepID=A0ABR4FMR8_9EURO
MAPQARAAAWRSELDYPGQNLPFCIASWRGKTRTAADDFIRSSVRFEPPPPSIITNLIFTICITTERLCKRHSLLALPALFSSTFHRQGESSRMGFNRRNWDHSSSETVDLRRKRLIHEYMRLGRILKDWDPTGPASLTWNPTEADTDPAFQRRESL